jgi:hypothetical protein
MDARTSPKRARSGGGLRGVFCDLAPRSRGHSIEAKNIELMNHSREIRLRAEIRAGELLIELKERGERDAPRLRPALQQLSLRNASLFRHLALG